MIVLDTNVVSELSRRHADPEVIGWADAQDARDLVITAVTAAEIRAGVALLPEGRRRGEIGAVMEAVLTDTFAGQVLPFDLGSTDHYARIVATRTRAGLPISGPDAQIAAISAQYAAVLATRNTADFEGLGLELVNPWLTGGQRSAR